MNNSTPSPQPNAAGTVNRIEPHISDDGEVIRLTVRGSTYVLKDETARIVRKHRARHADGVEAAAFWDGYLLCMSMMFSTLKEKPANGKAKKERQDESAVEG